MYTDRRDLYIVERRQRQMVISVSFLLGCAFSNAQGLYRSEEPTLPGIPAWKKLTADEQAANSACCIFTRIVLGASTRLDISCRSASVMSMLMNVLGTSNSLGDAPWKINMTRQS